jgi:TPR repeat protein
LAPQKVQADRKFSADEIDRMVRQGEAFLKQGDVSAARVVLVRAAEAHDPRAALALGSTYDPTVLQRMGAVGIKPDAEKAHFWYERAAEFGSGEANKRLTALAQLRDN